ncbi:MAG: MFS transporter [Pyrobaculum arsenaticum]|uniref:MFS transporter n=1 Tax=Pyrobaculum arsenaticum TaxID=121277 RepID=UPI0022755C85|nr:MFS transporter [Pyrobaculum arsenaticum]
MNIRLIIMLGLVSLFADWLYESMRAVAPQYLYMLGATAVIVGFVFGLGDALGYAARVVTGPLADRRGGYWLETFLGYGLQIAAVGGLIFAKDLWQAAGLIFLERFAKALRTPARDVLISAAGGGKAKGRAFGIHAALDQIGAIIGAAMATAMLYMYYTPRDVFATALLPGAVALALLYAAYRLSGVRPSGRGRVGGGWRAATAFAATQFFLGLSLTHISLFQYRLAEVPWLASLLFLIAMIAEVPASLLLGFLHDKSSKALLIGPVFTVLLALSFMAGGHYLFLGAALYAVATSYADVVAKAYAAKLGAAASLGLVNAMWGLGLLAGGVVYGFLTDMGIYWAIGALASAASLASFYMLWRLTTY